MVDAMYILAFISVICLSIEFNLLSTFSRRLPFRFSSRITSLRYSSHPFSGMIYLPPAADIPLDFLPLGLFRPIPAVFFDLFFFSVFFAIILQTFRGSYRLIRNYHLLLQRLHLYIQQDTHLLFYLKTKHYQYFLLHHHISRQVQLHP